MLKKLVLFIFSMTTLFSFSQDVFGVWETTDKKTGKATSHIKIFKGKDGKAYGKIVKIHDPKAQKDICTKCKGAKKNKPLLNLIIMQGLTKDGNEYNGGKITDTRDGKVYTCSIWLDGEDLKLRGYWGLFYQTETWKKVK